MATLLAVRTASLTLGASERHRSDVPPSAVRAPRATRNGYEGVLTAVVAVTGVRDDVQDVIVPGAFRDTLAKRRPKVCLHHQWQQPVGRVLDVKELMPGDPRLPSRTRQGSPWPREWGALVATMQFALNTKSGAEAFELARFYSEAGDADWSIGYKAMEGKASHRQGTRYLYAVDLYEVSLVLHGANPHTLTLDVKSVEEPELDTQDAPKEIRQAGSAAMAVMEAKAAREATAMQFLPTIVVIDSDGEISSLTADDFEIKAPLPGMSLSSREDIASAVKAYSKMPAPMKPGARKRIMMAAKKLGCLDAVPGSWKTPQMMQEAGMKPGSMMQQTKGDYNEDVEFKYDTSPVGTPGGRQNWVDQEGGLPAFVRAVAHALMRNGHSESGAIEMAIGVIRRWASGGGNVTAKTRAKAQKTIADWEAMKASANAKSLEGKMGIGMTGGMDDDDMGEMGMPIGGRDDDERGKRPELMGSLEERREKVRDAVEEYLMSEGLDTEDEAMPDDAPMVHVCIEATYDDYVIASKYENGQQETYQFPYQISSKGDVKLGKPKPVTLSVIALPDGASVPSDGSAASEEDTTMVRFMNPALSMIGEAESKLLAAYAEGKSVDLEPLRPAVENLLATLQDMGMDLESMFEWADEDGDEADAEGEPLTVTPDQADGDEADAEMQSEETSVTAADAGTDETVVLDPEQVRAELAELSA